MKKEYYIELIEEHPKANFYSIHLEEEELSELESFFEKYSDWRKYDEDIDTIIAWLDHIGEHGALERYFRHEGRYGDGVSAIPIDTGHLRLYCIRVNEGILIFGNGGEKDTRTWQESGTLSKYVKVLLDTSRFIASRVEAGSLYIFDKELIGNLKFTRYEKE